MKITWVKALQKKYIKKLPKRCNNEKKNTFMEYTKNFLKSTKEKKITGKPIDDYVKDITR